MKKNLFNWMTILMVVIVSVGFVSCGDDVVDPEPEPTPKVEGVVENGIWTEVTVEFMGRLAQVMGEERQFSVKNLKVTGPLNGADIRYLRKMMNSEAGGKLVRLDMADASIVKDYELYYDGYREKGDYSTQDNIMDDHMFDGCDVLRELVLPNSVVRIGGLFGNNTDINVQSITIGKSTIGTYDEWDFEFDDPEDANRLGFLYGMDKLEEIKVHPDNLKFTSVDGVMYSKDKTVLLNVPPEYKGKSFSIPKTVNIIDSYAFCYNSRLESVEIPYSVKTIRSRAFWSCYKLRSIYLGGCIPPVFEESYYRIREIGDVLDCGNNLTVYAPKGMGEDLCHESMIWKELTIKGYDIQSNAEDINGSLIGSWSFEMDGEERLYSFDPKGNFIYQSNTSDGRRQIKGTYSYVKDTGTITFNVQENWDSEEGTSYPNSKTEVKVIVLTNDNLIYRYSREGNNQYKYEGYKKATVNSLW